MVCLLSHMIFLSEAWQTDSTVYSLQHLQDYLKIFSAEKLIAKREHPQVITL